ncbi:MAG: phosphoenolpyruvate carboxylase [Nitrososphaerota archaeon]|nr:phosphoenolpyruvate carboxylase [Candidatus Calditenuaceae archaeon]MDW8072855.1 phosphoenolpyruvate carboxylase [Nitrososphaerota archaeon]
MERIIPRTMASQHPDNATLPPWCDGELIAGEDEVREAFVAYSEYGCHEVMWDAEGKDIDPHVVRKLLSTYPEYFKEKHLGRDIFLTFRIPNPLIEVAERKVFLESLQAIPRHNDVARIFYQDDSVSVFEVILPFTSSHTDIVRVKEVYRHSVVEPLSTSIDFRGFTLRDLLGDVRPRDLEVIPLFEDIDSIVNMDTIMTKYIELFSPPYIRAFIARSDPALTYGFITATLLAKLGLSKCRSITERLGTPVTPIIGAGCLPFRGHNSPKNVEKFVEEYSGVWTVTIQSAFRYDFPIELSAKSVEMLNNLLPRENAVLIDGEQEVVVLKTVAKLMKVYGDSLEHAADEVNSKSRLLPSRRARKLHIGLFSYSRKFRNATLPRAIPYTGFFYTLGMPPEFIGLRALRDLTEEEYKTVRELHKNLIHDLSFSAKFMSWENLSLLSEGHPEARKIFRPSFLERFIPQYTEDIKTAEEMLGIKCGPRTLLDRKYVNVVENFLISLLEENEAEAKAELLRAAKLRGSLG